MEEETRYTKQDLETMRAWTLQRKIQVTQTRLIEWLGRYDWNVYVSFSGGKDSSWANISVRMGAPDSTVRSWHDKAVLCLGKALDEVPMAEELLERASRARTY